MPGFKPLPASSITWTQNVLGAEVARLYTNGAVMTIVRGNAGDLIPAHGYSHGSVTYVVSGRLDIDGQVLGPCLLYTSPSPRDRQKSRMPSSA